jgi:hypothetical protein
MLSVEDEIEAIPALEFICLGYSELFECIYEIHFWEPVHQRQFHLMAWMSTQLLCRLPNVCNFRYVSIFVEDVIIGFEC